MVALLYMYMRTVGTAAFTGNETVGCEILVGEEVKEIIRGRGYQ
jgi:hypothetical protein